MDIPTQIARIRESTCAVMRVTRKEKKRRKKGKTEREVEVSLSFVGTAWCIVENQLLVTAHHVFNGGRPRNPEHRFYVFSVPGNGPKAFRFPVTGFPLEDPKTDVAVLRIGDPPREGIEIPALPLALGHPPDGTTVLTVGYPAPEISSASVTPAGELRGGGQFFLKSHANQGIVSAQYELDDGWYFEFNVGWHHGESGGPVVRLEPEPAVFSIMQHYRDVQSPHGVLPGPRRGISLAVVGDRLRELGARIVE